MIIVSIVEQGDYFYAEKRSTMDNKMLRLEIEEINHEKKELVARHIRDDGTTLKREEVTFAFLNRRIITSDVIKVGKSLSDITQVEQI